MTDDVLLIRARAYLRERIREALQLAENDVTKMLRITKAAGTDHAFDCSQLAVALIYDVVKDRGRPQRTTSGSLGISDCQSFDEIARSIADNAAKAALAAIGSTEGKSDSSR